MPGYDRKDANDFTRKYNIKHIWIKSLELENPAYLQNDPKRCYYCKTELFSLAKEYARKNNLSWIMYGYNASDTNDFRPGHQAAIENGILYPLSEIGFKKPEIRQVLREHGLNIAEKPASPCLSSRIAHGIPITKGRLNDVGFLEDILKNAGIKVFRVRINKNDDDYFLRIEIDNSEMEKVLAIKEQLCSQGKKCGYKWITLDLSGYRTGGGTE